MATLQGTGLFVMLSECICPNILLGHGLETTSTPGWANGGEMCGVVSGGGVVPVHTEGRLIVTTAHNSSGPRGHQRQKPYIRRSSGRRADIWLCGMLRLVQ